MAGVEELKPRLQEAVTAVLRSETTNSIYRVVAETIVRQDVKTSGTEKHILDRLDSINERLSTLSKQQQQRTRDKRSDSTSALHHLRLQGEAEDINRFMTQVREGRFGGRVMQFQRYSAEDAAANIAADAALDVSKLLEAATQHNLTARIQFIRMEEPADGG
jgi:hypothetical protein